MENRTYRYYKDNPLYPFGHGLSYTSYSYSDLSFDAENRKVSFVLSNEGPMDGEEVSFVWCSTDSEDAPSNPCLCGFVRSFVAAGERKTVTVDLDKRLGTLVDHKGVRYVRSGKWRIYVSGSQIDDYSLSLSGSNVLAAEIDI